MGAGSTVGALGQTRPEYRGLTGNYGTHAKWNREHSCWIRYAEQKRRLLAIEFAKTVDPRLDAIMDDDATGGWKDLSARTRFSDADQMRFEHLEAVIDADMASVSQAKEYKALSKKLAASKATARVAVKATDIPSGLRTGWLSPDGSFHPAGLLGANRYGDLSPFVAADPNQKFQPKETHAEWVLAWLKKYDRAMFDRLCDADEAEIKNEMLTRGWVRVAEGGQVNYLAGKTNKVQRDILKAWSAEDLSVTFAIDDTNSEGGEP